MTNISIYIDLIIDIYNMSNPILIYEKIHEEFDVDISIHQISDYLDIHRNKTYEKLINNEYEFAY